MHWTWRFYVTLALALGASIAFMDVVGTVLEFDAATWWRVLLALWLGLSLGYAPGFVALSLVARMAAPRRVWALAGAVVAGTAIGAPLYRVVVETLGGRWSMGFLDWLADASSLLGLLAVIAVALEFQLRQQESAAAMHRQSLREVQGRRDAAAMRAQALAAQAEPHFLFNTLANVRELVESGSPQASKVLDTLIA